MDRSELRRVLGRVRSGRLRVEEALEVLRRMPVEPLGFASLDLHRALRRGVPEVIYGQGKSVEQIVTLVNRRTFALRIDGQTLRDDMVSRPALTIENERLTWDYAVGGFKVSIVYELRPGWTFLSKHVLIEPEKPGPFRVDDINALTATLDRAPRETISLTDGRFGTLLRFARAGEATPSFGIFMLFQNPYNVWKIEGPAIDASYAPGMQWRPEWGVCASDRLCLGFTRFGGLRSPARAVPEWKFVSDYPKYLAENAVIDLGEAEAVVEYVRAFLLYKSTKSVRVHVPWCENDYQIDVSTADGWAEYKRILDL